MLDRCGRRQFRGPLGTVEPSVAKRQQTPPGRVSTGLRFDLDILVVIFNRRRSCRVDESTEIVLPTDLFGVIEKQRDGWPVAADLAGDDPVPSPAPVGELPE